MHGFTMVELIMVIVILGILAAVVGPRFFDRKLFDERMFFEESLAAVRYAQKLAVASGCSIRVQIPSLEAGSDGYALSYSQACGDIVADTHVKDFSGGEYIAPLPAGVTITQPLDVTFASLGCLTVAAPDCVAGAPVDAVIGGFTLRIHVETGFVESRP